MGSRRGTRFSAGTATPPSTSWVSAPTRSRDDRGHRPRPRPRPDLPLGDLEAARALPPGRPVDGRPGRHPGHRRPDRDGPAVSQFENCDLVPRGWWSPHYRGLKVTIGIVIVTNRAEGWWKAYVGLA